MTNHFIVPVLLSAAMASMSVKAAALCDYSPSKLIGETATAATAGGAAGAAVAGVGMKAAGLYAMQHAVTGAWMLGSTAAGASAAGTAGILGGTAGVVGTIGAVLLSTPVIVGAGVVAVGVGAYEGGCYLAKKK